MDGLRGNETKHTALITNNATLSDFTSNQTKWEGFVTKNITLATAALGSDLSVRDSADASLATARIGVSQIGKELASAYNSTQTKIVETFAKVTKLQVDIDAKVISLRASISSATSGELLTVGHGMDDFSKILTIDASNNNSCCKQ